MNDELLFLSMSQKTLDMYGDETSVFSQKPVLTIRDFSQVSDRDSDLSFLNNITPESKRFKGRISRTNPEVSSKIYFIRADTELAQFSLRFKAICVCLNKLFYSEPENLPKPCFSAHAYRLHMVRTFFL